MDDQNLNQQPSDNFEPQVPSPGQQFQPKISDPIHHPKKSKKKVLLIVLLVLLLAGGAAAAYYFFFKKDAPAPVAETPASVQQTETKPTGPTALIYDPDNTDATVKLSSLNLSDSKTTTYDTKDYSMTSLQAIKGAKIAVVVAPKEKQTKYAIFYSSDNGNTYTKLYETVGSKDTNTNGDQITSIAFSSDGTKIIFGLLPAEATKNIVTELNPENKATKTIFTASTAGVFIKGYNNDGTSNKVIYTKGCYGCDGLITKSIYSYDVSAKKETTLVTSKATIDPQNVIVDDGFKSVYYVEASTKTNEIGVELTAPYTINQLTLSDLKVSALKTYGTKNATTFTKIGFLSGSNTLYFADDKTVNSLNDGKVTALFTSTKSLYNVQYVSTTQVYVSTGDYTAFTVSKFNITDKSLTDILKGTKQTNVLGITSNDYL